MGIIIILRESSVTIVEGSPKHTTTRTYCSSMTDYAKWDAIVASLSSSDDSDSSTDEAEEASASGSLEASRSRIIKATPGVGKPLTHDGRIDPPLRPGNARGNALSTNASNSDVVDLPHDSASVLPFTQNNETINIAAILRRGPHPASSSASASAQSGVTCKFTSTSVEVLYRPPKAETGDATGNLPTVRWAYKNLHRNIDPEKSTFHVGSSEVVAAEMPNDAVKANRCAPSGSLVVKLTLRKQKENETWEAPSIGTRLWDERKRLRVVTITDYSWVDLYQGAKVFIKVPNVHTLPSDAVRVRFRELSFDVCVGPLPAPGAPPGAPADCEYRFAVTELPLEIIVDKCNYRVDDTDGGRIKIYVRKFAKTPWFKLAVHRDALWLDDELSGKKKPSTSA